MIFELNLCVSNGRCRPLQERYDHLEPKVLGILRHVATYQPRYVLKIDDDYLPVVHRLGLAAAQWACLGAGGERGGKENILFVCTEVWMQELVCNKRIQLR